METIVILTKQDMQALRDASQARFHELAEMERDDRYPLNVKDAIVKQSRDLLAAWEKLRETT